MSAIFYKFDFYINNSMFAKFVTAAMFMKLNRIRGKEEEDDDDDQI